MAKPRRQTFEGQAVPRALYRAEAQEDEDAPEPVADDPTTQLAAAMIGVGASYYIMPHNVYLGGAIGVMGGEADNVDDDGIQDEPLRVQAWLIQLEGGKEWWVSENWGLGVGGRLAFGRGQVHEIAPEDEAAREPIDAAGGLYSSDLGHFTIAVVGSATFL